MTQRHTISGRIRLVWGLRVVLFAIVVCVIGLGIAWIVDPMPELLGVGLPTVSIVVAGVVVVLELPLVHLRYAVWVYEVRDDALYLEHGVSTHVRSIVPFVRIQHVDTRRGPIERSLGLSRLVVFTAGSHRGAVALPGLNPEEARRLQHRVEELAIEAEGGVAV